MPKFSSVYKIFYCIPLSHNTQQRWTPLVGVLRRFKPLILSVKIDADDLHRRCIYYIIFFYLLGPLQLLCFDNRQGVQVRTRLHGDTTKHDKLNLSSFSAVLSYFLFVAYLASFTHIKFMRISADAIHTNSVVIPLHVKSMKHHHTDPLRSRRRCQTTHLHQSTSYPMRSQSSAPLYL